MKKVDAKKILIQLAILLVVGIAVGVIGGLIAASNMGLESPTMVMIPLMIVALMAVLIPWFIITVRGGSSRAAKKTLNEFLDKEKLQTTSTFYSNDAIVVVDHDAKRVIYVAHLNPKEVQIANANELSDVKTDYIKAPLGGTTMVYFTFRFNGKKTRVPTLLADSPLSLKSEKVLEAMSKADAFVEMIKNA